MPRPSSAGNIEQSVSSVHHFRGMRRHEARVRQYEDMRRSLQADLTQMVRQEVSRALAQRHLEGDAHSAEVRDRLAVVAPVLEAQVLAATCGRPPDITGEARLRRNVACHYFGGELSVSDASVAELRRVQRGPRIAQSADEEPRATDNKEEDLKYDDEEQKAAEAGAEPRRSRCRSGRFGYWSLRLAVVIVGCMAFPRLSYKAPARQRPHA